MQCLVKSKKRQKLDGLVQLLHEADTYLPRYIHTAVHFMFFPSTSPGLI